MQERSDRERRTIRKQKNGRTERKRRRGVGERGRMESERQSRDKPWRPEIRICKKSQKQATPKVW
jgi:hypothetical protein